MPKVSSWDFLEASATSSFAPCTADLARSIAGRTRWLHELATGEASGRPCTPKNPQGNLGIDMSGPPWGSAPRHHIANIGSYADTSLVQSPGIAALGYAKRLRFACWVRPHEPTALAPYSRLKLHLVASNSAAGSAVYGVTAFRRDGSAARSSSVTITGTTVATYAVSSFYVDAQPGVNFIDVEISFTSGTGTATFWSASLCNDVKRSH